MKRIKATAFELQTFRKKELYRKQMMVNKYGNEVMMAIRKGFGL
jgi:hypothetical protein